MEKGNSTDKYINATAVLGKIEKVPMGIQDEKSRKDPASSGKPVSTIGAQASPQKRGRNHVSGKVSVPRWHASVIAMFHGNHS